MNNKAMIIGAIIAIIILIVILGAAAKVTKNMSHEISQIRQEQKERQQERQQEQQQQEQEQEHPLAGSSHGLPSGLYNELSNSFPNGLSHGIPTTMVNTFPVSDPYLVGHDPYLNPPIIYDPIYLDDLEYGIDRRDRYGDRDYYDRRDRRERKRDRRDRRRARKERTYVEPKLDNVSTTLATKPPTIQKEGRIFNRKPVAQQLLVTEMPLQARKHVHKHEQTKKMPTLQQHVVNGSSHSVPPLSLVPVHDAPIQIPIKEEPKDATASSSEEKQVEHFHCSSKRTTYPLNTQVQLAIVPTPEDGYITLVSEYNKRRGGLWL